MHFDYKRKVRMNTPPCCRQNLLAMLKHFTKELRRLNVDHILAYGGVIGWMRNKKMIPYDLDLDLMIDIRFWNTPLMKQMLQQMRDLHGYDTIVKKGGNKLWVAYSMINRIHIDIWPYTKNIIHGNWMVSIPLLTGGQYHPLHTIFPT